MFVSITPEVRVLRQLMEGKGGRKAPPTRNIWAKADILRGNKRFFGGFVNSSSSQKQTKENKNHKLIYGSCVFRNGSRAAVPAPVSFVYIYNADPPTEVGGTDPGEGALFIK